MDDCWIVNRWNWKRSTIFSKSVNRFQQFRNLKIHDSVTETSVSLTIIYYVEYAVYGINRTGKISCIQLPLHLAIAMSDRFITWCQAKRSENSMCFVSCLCVCACGVLHDNEEEGNDSSVPRYAVVWVCVKLLLDDDDDDSATPTSVLLCVF